jgi:small-conductance mechanosensitive channel
VTVFINDNNCVHVNFEILMLSSFSLMHMLFFCVGSGMARYVLSVWATTKIAAGSFLVGVIVGFRLKNTIRKGAEKLLKRLQRD